MGQLKRQLTARHISMIALGGSLGTGIFLTSGSALYLAGPGGALLAYLIMGLVVYLLMNSLGEMAAYRPVSGSFCQYASDYVSKPFGFAMGYNYWLNWAITIAVELIAAAIVMSFWFPTVNPIDWCALFFVAILTLNCLPVKNYGETEFWLSLIKVITIIAFIIVGLFIILGVNKNHHGYGIQNWHQADGPFHGGLKSLFAVFILSGFSFQGTELVGIAAGEAKDPQNSIPRAIRQVFWRLLLFYILTMAIIGFIIPFTDSRLLNTHSSIALSPFTLILSQTGFHWVAQIMNGVILLALLSACNSDMYSATRVLWHLSESGSAPKCFSKLNRFGIPIYSLLATSAFGLLAFLCHFIGSTTIFLWLVSISSLAGFMAWFGIALSHYYFRKHYVASGKKVDDLPFRSHFYPWGPIFALLLCVIIIIGQGYVLIFQHTLSWQSFISTYIGVPAVILLWLGNKIYHQKKQ